MCVLCDLLGPVPETKAKQDSYQEHLNLNKDAFEGVKKVLAVCKGDKEKAFENLREAVKLAERLAGPLLGGVPVDCVLGDNVAFQLRIVELEEEVSNLTKSLEEYTGIKNEENVNNG